MVSSYFSGEAPDLMTCVKEKVAECPEKFTKGLHMTLTLIGNMKKEVCIFCEMLSCTMGYCMVNVKCLCHGLIIGQPGPFCIVLD